MVEENITCVSRERRNFFYNTLMGIVIEGGRKSYVAFFYKRRNSPTAKASGFLVRICDLKKGFEDGSPQSA